MWTRFSINAKNSVGLANVEAYRCGESSVCTDHLLLGLLRTPDSGAGRVLEAFEVDVPSICDSLAGPETCADTPTCTLPLTPAVRMVIEAAHSEACGLASPVVGSEHLLLALIQDGRGRAGALLRSQGVDLETARAHAQALKAEEPAAD